MDAKAEGVSLRNYPTIDGHRASEINFEKVSVESSHVIGEVGKASILEEAIDRGIIAAGAEAVGAMEVLYKSTVEYCKTREQFGQPIGNFRSFNIGWLICLWSTSSPNLCSIWRP